MRSASLQLHRYFDTFEFFSEVSLDKKRDTVLSSVQVNELVARYAVKSHMDSDTYGQYQERIGGRSVQL